VAGLADRSRKPLHSPSQFSDEVIAHIVAQCVRFSRFVEEVPHERSTGVA